MSPEQIKEIRLVIEHLTSQLDSSTGSDSNFYKEQINKLTDLIISKFK